MTALAVVIVAYDSAADLKRTLPALLPQLRADDELVIVDNGPAFDLAVPDRARLVRDGVNDGFAGGAARGAAATTAPLLFFLNPDSVPEPGCLDALRGAPEAWAAWQALVLLPDGAINTSGNVVHWTGLSWARDAPATAPREVAFASGAALVVRRHDWERVGGFDPAYFMYGEDLDLCLRLRLNGRAVGILPDARVVHEYEFAKGDYKWFHLERNRWWTVLTVYPAPLLLAALPALLALEVVLLVVAARGGWLGAKLRSQAAVLRSLPRLRRRRRRIAATRRATVGSFAAVLTDRIDSAYLAVPGGANVAQSGVWRIIRHVAGARRAKDPTGAA